MISILKSGVVRGEGSFKLGILVGHPPPFLIWYACCNKKGVGKLDVPLLVHLLRWFFLLSWTWVLPFYSLYSPLSGVLWFIYDWQGFINAKHNTPLKVSKVCYRALLLYSQLNQYGLFISHPSLLLYDGGTVYSYLSRQNWVINA